MSVLIDELIKKSGTAITNGLNVPGMAEPLLNYGYSSEVLQSGLALHEKANALNINQKKEDGEQMAATVALNDSIVTANGVYMPFVKVARVAFRNDVNMQIKLDLIGKRKRSQGGFLGQTKVFYTNLLADEAGLTRMKVFGQTREKLENGFQLIHIVEDNIAKRKKEMGEAQDATALRDKAVDDLQEWYSDYIEIARLALDGQPQYLEMLGIIEP